VNARRTWLFVPGADVIVLELEDFTPPELRPKAYELSEAALASWRKAGALAAVRVNPLETCGHQDLAGVIGARPDLIMMSKVATPQQIIALEKATGGTVDLVPNVESALGLKNTFEIGKACRRIVAMLVASEDMVADLGTERSRGGEELAYVRARFLLECRAAGVEAIDCPYTFSDVKGAIADARYARRLGYRMKSLVDPSHAKGINKVLTPDFAKAKKIVAAFEKARKQGKDRALVDGLLVEVPIYAAAKRLLESAARSSPPPQKKPR